MKRTQLRIVTLLVLLAILAMFILNSCGSARRGEPVAPGVLSGDPDIAAGREAFMKICHRCHPGGEAGLGPALNNKPLPAFAIKTQVRHGFGKMPAFSKDQISDKELDNIIKYVQSLRKGVQ